MRDACCVVGCVCCKGGIPRVSLNGSGRSFIPSEAREAENAYAIEISHKLFLPYFVCFCIHPLSSPPNRTYL
jgi:hypothetical protein